MINYKIIDEFIDLVNKKKNVCDVMNFDGRVIYNIISKDPLLSKLFREAGSIDDPKKEYSLNCDSACITVHRNGHYFIYLAAFKSLEDFFLAAIKEQIQYKYCELENIYSLKIFGNQLLALLNKDNASEV